MARWLVAGTDVDARYPCQCSRADRCDPAWCACAGRPDADTMPPRCCSRRYGPADVVLARREYDARKLAKSRRSDNGG